MFDIQPVSGGDFDLSLSHPDEMEEKGSIEPESETLDISGDSLKKAVAEESLHRATSQNLILSQKEQAAVEILTQSKDLKELFDLGKELLMLAIEGYKEGGGDLKELDLLVLHHPIGCTSQIGRFEDQEHRRVLLYWLGKDRSFEEKLKGYLLLFHTGIMANFNVNDWDSIFKIYELIPFFDQLGLSFNKDQFLVLQYFYIEASMEHKECYVYHTGGTEEEIEYVHWKVDIALPWTLKLIQEAQELQKTINQNFAKTVITRFIIDDTATRTVREDYDPLTPLLPFLIEYGEVELLDDCRECFDRMHAELLPWDRELQWALLYLEGAQMLKEKDFLKGERYIQRAKALIEKRFSTYFLSSNQDQWKKAKETAYAEYQRVSELYTQNQLLKLFGYTPECH